MARGPRWFIPALLLGLAIRVLGLPLWGTFDTEVQKAWSARAATAGMADIYGPPDREVLATRSLLEALTTELPRTRFTWGTAEYFVDYPPGSVVVLWAAGKAYGLVRPDLPNKPLFNAFINLAPLLGSLAIAWMLRGCALWFWLSPAMILAAPVLGYQDTIFGTAALGAVIALLQRRHALAFALVAVAGLVKPQGALLVPALLVLSARELDGKGWLRSIAAGVGASVVVLAPWWTQGYLLSALDGCRRPLTQATLAPLGYNVWWIAGWLAEGRPALAQVVLTNDFAAAAFDPRPVSRLLLLAATVFGAAWLWRAPRELLPLAIAWQVHAYTLLGTSVHENHAFLAPVLLALLVGTWPPAQRFLVASSAFLFANLFLIAGIGRRLTKQRTLEALRTLPGIDLSVLVAIGNVALVTALAVAMIRTLRQPGEPQATV